MRGLMSWLRSLQSRNTSLHFAEAAFRAKYPTTQLYDVEMLAEDDVSYFIQVRHGSFSCRMASFWSISKADFCARELRSSELNRVLVHLAAEEELHVH
jgi:hypothetical protein